MTKEMFEEVLGAVTRHTMRGVNPMSVDRAMESIEAVRLVYAKLQAERDKYKAGHDAFVEALNAASPFLQGGEGGSHAHLLTIGDRILADGIPKLCAEIDRLKAERDNEKQIRIKYQDIVYALCNLADRRAGRKPGTGVTVDALVADIERQLREDK